MMKATSNLSSGILQMKFMTKTRKKLEEQEDKRRNQELKKEFIKDVKEEGLKRRHIESCKDLTVLEDLAFGRMSFKGCNPEVEKLMYYYERKRRGEQSDDDEGEDNETEFTDAQMAQTLSGAASSIANKFKGKGGNKRKADSNHNIETSSHRLNFDEATVRKRKSGPEDFSHGLPKFMKPSD